MYETVNLEIRDGAAWVELNRPDALNAWNTQLGEDLHAAIHRAAADDDARVVVITGAGRAFSSGADLKEGFEPTPAGHPDVHTRLTQTYHPIMTAIRRMPKPVVAAVNGPAVGIGCSLALACDLILAAESAFFGLAFVNIGLMPDGGSTLFVPAAVGKARAFQMALLGERVHANQALEWGLVNHVHPDDALAREAEALAARLAAGPTRSYGASKEALNRMIYPDMEGQLHLEAELQHQLGRTQDFLEGVGAFVEKRQAAFTGA